MRRWKQALLTSIMSVVSACPSFTAHSEFIDPHASNAPLSNQSPFFEQSMNIQPPKLQKIYSKQEVLSPQQKAEEVPTKGAQQEPSTITYTIRPGDTLSKIAQNHGTTLESLLETNAHITNPDFIRSGESIILFANSPTIRYTGPKITDFSIAKKEQITSPAITTSDPCEKYEEFTTPLTAYLSSPTVFNKIAHCLDRSEFLQEHRDCVDDDAVYAHFKENGLNKVHADLYLGIIQQESSRNCNAISTTGAMGAPQIKPIFYNNARDAPVNPMTLDGVLKGADFFIDLLTMEKYDDLTTAQRLQFAVAAYQMGEPRAKAVHTYLAGESSRSIIEAVQQLPNPTMQELSYTTKVFDRYKQRRAACLENSSTTQDQCPTALSLARVEKPPTPPTLAYNSLTLAYHLGK